MKFINLGDPQALYMLLLYIQQKEVEQKVEIFKFIVNQFDVNQNTPLILAVNNEWIDAIKMLLSVGANIFIRDRNKFHSVHWAIIKGNQEILELLTKNHSQKEPDVFLPYSYLELSVIYQSKKIQIMNYLLANNTYHGAQLVHFAVNTSKVTFLKKLVSSNVPIDKKNILGITPLHLACSISGDNGFNMAKILTDSKANVNTQSDKSGYTPIMYAVLSPNPSLSLVLLLISLKADLLIKEKQFGSNVLMMSLKEKWAFKTILKDAPRELLEMKDNNGMSVADLATSYPDETIRKEIDLKIKSL